jgi:hypothetical protein
LQAKHILGLQVKNRGLFKGLADHFAGVFWGADVFFISGNRIPTCQWELEILIAAIGMCAQLSWGICWVCLPICFGYQKKSFWELELCFNCTGFGRMNGMGRRNSRNVGIQ